MKFLPPLLVALTSLLAASPNVVAQCYDTCAPHRHALYGYSGAGYGFGVGYGRVLRGPVRPYQGLVNPRYVQPSVEYVVVAPTTQGPARPQVYLPRDIRERKQAELEVASDSELLQERQEPVRPRPNDYESPAIEARRPSVANPPRVTLPQPELIAAQTYTSPGFHVPSRSRPMTPEAADEYVARSAAALARLRARRTKAEPVVVAEGSAVAANATDTAR